MLKPITSFQVLGAPVGKGRARHARRGNFVQTYTPEKTANYEALVKAAAIKAMRGKQPCVGATQLNLGIYAPIPKSWSKIKRERALSGLDYPTTKPDSSNVLKGVEDAMNGVVYGDDSHIVNHVITKRYSDNPRVEVRVYEVTNV